MIAQGEFREDLYYRLNGAQLRLPPLRERADKLYVIRQVFSDVVKERGESQRHGYGPMLSALLFAWPGNIRQLKTRWRLHSPPPRAMKSPFTTYPNSALANALLATHNTESEATDCHLVTTAATPMEH